MSFPEEWKLRLKGIELLETALRADVVRYIERNDQCFPEVRARVVIGKSAASPFLVRRLTDSIGFDGNFYRLFPLINEETLVDGERLGDEAVRDLLRDGKFMMNLVNSVHAGKPV